MGMRKYLSLILVHDCKSIVFKADKLGMNIKGLFANILPMTPVRDAAKTEKALKMDATADRDANGQQATGGEQEHREPMSEEQLQKSLEALRNLPAIKEHQWTVELVIIETKRFAHVKDTEGNLIRRIPEIELWTLPHSAETGKGQLLKKTA